MSDLQLDLRTRTDAAGLQTLVILKHLSVARHTAGRGAQVLRRPFGNFRIDTPCLLEKVAFKFRYFGLERQGEQHVPASREENHLTPTSVPKAQLERPH